MPLVAFQWAAIRKVWTYGSKVMRFLRFQPKFGHAISHCLCSKICPKLPKFAKICPKTKLWNTTKNRDFSFFQNQQFLHVEEALEHVFTVRIFNPIIFYMLFYCQKSAFVCEFQHTPMCKMTFFSRFHMSRGYEILLTCI
jgi:hypothetical protein